jgi:transcriptional regulator with XRE-family HTH domain
MAACDEDDARAIQPDGLAIRGRRHQRGWSPRDLIEAIGAAHEAATGVRESIAPALLSAVEERNARIPYATLRLIAAGLDCNPVELLAPAAAEAEGLAPVRQPR